MVVVVVRGVVTVVLDEVVVVVLDGGVIEVGEVLKVVVDGVLIVVGVVLIVVVGGVLIVVSGCCSGGSRMLSCDVDVVDMVSDTSDTGAPPCFAAERCIAEEVRCRTGRPLLSAGMAMISGSSEKVTFKGSSLL